MLPKSAGFSKKSNTCLHFMLDVMLHQQPPEMKVRTSEKDRDLSQAPIFLRGDLKYLRLS
jgi:hypothetical protein